MILHCPFCKEPIQCFDAVVMDAHVTIAPAYCVNGQCGKRLDTSALFSAAVPGFPLLGADERWRAETCGTCGFRVEGICRESPPGADGYQEIADCVKACSRWRERRGE